MPAYCISELSKKKRKKTVFMVCSNLRFNPVSFVKETIKSLETIDFTTLPIMPSSVKPVLSGHSKKRLKIGILGQVWYLIVSFSDLHLLSYFQDRLLLNAGQKYCRMLQGSILQYIQASSSYHLFLRPLFWLFLSSGLKQVLL